MTDNTATTWRELADELTPQQVEQLTAGTYMQPDELLDAARDFAATNLLQAALADVPDPAGAIEATRWYHDGETANRTVYARRWSVGNVTVAVLAEQTEDGAAVWRIEVREAEQTDGELTAAQARELAQALTAAADELERLQP